MGRLIRVPDALRRKARAEGDACVGWIDDLGDLVAEMEDQWCLLVGDPMGGGTASFVAPATLSDGSDAVLKLAMPASIDGWDALDREYRVLLASNGHGCVTALAHDADRHALLMERLGRPLAEIGLSLTRQLEVTCEVLQQFWTAPADPELPSAPAKARWLASFIAETWETLERPCPSALVDHAFRVAERRARAFRPERAVLVHGDVHAWNTLQVPAGTSRFRLVDPDGLYAEPEYDLAISMREYNDQLLAGDPRDLGRQRARFLARLTATDPQAIWEWGFLERLSTGLYLIKIDKDAAAGRTFLRIAEAWADP